MKHLIKYFNSPAFTEAQWAARNPVLEKGEVGYVLNNSGVVTGMKVGPGAWNTLALLGSDIYPYNTPVTNPIGDATGVLENQTLASILNKMLNPYAPPVVSAAVNNTGAGLIATRTLEIGQSVSGPVQVSFGLTNIDKLSGATPVRITAGGVFSNEGNFAYTLPALLNLSTPLNPVTVTTITISIYVVHQKGNSNTVTTVIRFYPKLMWGSSPLTNLTGPQFMSIANRATLISNVFRNDYTFSGGGYSWLAVPSMLGASNLVFTDVTNPNLPANYAMESMGVISINNGVATYNYDLYRSSFNLINSTKLRVS